METPLSLSLLYTANIGGDLTLLPRLYTFLQRLKAEDSRNSLLLDLGRTCSDAVWHCRATGGRSTLTVLDGMGYHAANVADTLDAANRDKLAAQVTLALVDRQHPRRFRLTAAAAVIVAIQPVDGDASPQILLEPDIATRLEGGILRLQSVGYGQVGQVSVNLQGEPNIVSRRIHDMPSDTAPNASIAGAVEFVESEARYFLNTRADDSG